MSTSAKKGDSHSHGGSVTEGSSVTTVGGIGLTYVGASGTCPKKGHNNVSVASSGNRNVTTVGGRVAASTGASMTCGGSVNGSGTRTSIS